MDNRCASNIPGLYAAGDALGSHMVGGTYTQIGSSLAGSAVHDALAYIEELRDHAAPMLRAANMHELRLAHETRNMILSAEMKLRASLAFHRIGSFAINSSAILLNSLETP